jgi:hypothetical protein
MTFDAHCNKKLQKIIFDLLSPMTKTALSLRLDPPQLAHLQALAARYKVTDATIIRWALDALSDYVTAHNGRCMLPIDFNELWERIEKRQPLHGLNEEPAQYGNQPRTAKQVSVTAEELATIQNIGRQKKKR